MFLVLVVLRCEAAAWVGVWTYSLPGVSATGLDSLDGRLKQRVNDSTEPWSKLSGERVGFVFDCASLPPLSKSSLLSLGMSSSMVKQLGARTRKEIVKWQASC